MSILLGYEQNSYSPAIPYLNGYIHRMEDTSLNLASWEWIYASAGVVSHEEYAPAESYMPVPQPMPEWTCVVGCNPVPTPDPTWEHTAVPEPGYTVLVCLLLLIAVLYRRAVA